MAHPKATFQTSTIQMGVPNSLFFVFNILWVYAQVFGMSDLYTVHIAPFGIERCIVGCGQTLHKQDVYSEHRTHVRCGTGWIDRCYVKL